MAQIFVNADWSAVVPEGHPDARYGVQPKDAKRLGIDKLPVLAGAELGDLPEPETAEQFVLRSASLLPEQPEANVEPEADAAEDPEAKEAPKPADKAVRKPRTK